MIAAGSLGLLGLLTASTPAQPAPAYYIALGDSLAAGVQPDAGGRNRATSQGYVDDVARALRSAHPGLQTIKLGGRGTSADLLNGAPVDPSHGPGSQLRQAEAL